MKSSVGIYLSQKKLIWTDLTCIKKGIRKSKFIGIRRILELIYLSQQNFICNDQAQAGSNEKIQDILNEFWLDLSKSIEIDLDWTDQQQE